MLCLKKKKVVHHIFVNNNICYQLIQKICTSYATAEPQKKVEDVAQVSYDIYE